MLAPLIPAQAGIQSLRKMLFYLWQTLVPRVRGDEPVAGAIYAAKGGVGSSPNTAAILCCSVWALNGLTM
jgi:hypothetical protein